MSNAVIHAESSANQFGGTPDDYLDIHRFLDSLKAHLGDNRHRIILHNAWGVELCCRLFGDVVQLPEGKRAFVKDIVERHILEDLGFIPTLYYALSATPTMGWMSGRSSRATKEIGETAELTPPYQRIVLVVQRASREEWTHAIVSCRKTEQLLMGDSVFPRIREAVTEWVAQTDSGWTAWADSSEDFNVGDLSHELSDAVLQNYLARHGIHDLQIETVVHDKSLWTYDDVLVDTSKLPDNR